MGVEGRAMTKEGWEEVVYIRGSSRPAQTPQFQRCTRLARPLPLCKLCKYLTLLVSPVAADLRISSPNSSFHGSNLDTTIDILKFDEGR